MRESGTNVRYRTKRRIRRIVFITLIALAFIGALTFVIYRVINPVAPVSKRTVTLPVSPGGVYGWESGFLCVNDRTLVCVDETGLELWTAELPDSGMSVTRAFGMTAAWKGRQYVLIDMSGTQVGSWEIATDILMMRCGGSGVALLTREEEQHRLWVYDFRGNVVDEARFPHLSVIAMEYYGGNGKQLWVLVLDSHGTVPVSFYRSYHPGESTTGAITLNEQVAYSALPTDKEVFIVGTHNLIGRRTSDNAQYNKLIYGWSLQDQRRSADQACFLLAPSNTGDQEAVLSTLWYIAAPGEEYRIPLPSGCFRALIGSSGLVAVTREGIYTMQTDGTRRTFTKMPFLIDRVAAVSPGKAMAVESGGLIYLIPLA
jgi:hypothetical protein